MDQLPPLEFEQRISRELKQLPGLEAPSTLIPSVLTAIRLRAERFWYQQGWAAWPLWAKSGFFGVYLAAAAVLTWIVLNPQPLADVQQNVDKNIPLLRVVANAAGVLASVATSMIQAYQMWFYAAAAVLFVMYVACLMLGTLSLRILSRIRL